MPCYFFTYHAYLSWLLDRKQGYVRRDEGVLPPDPEMAEQYRRNATQTPVTFDHQIQKLLIDEVQIASGF